MSPPADSISQWLENHGLADLAPLFIEHRVTPDVLPTLTADDFREMGITALGHRKRLAAAVQALDLPGVLPPSGTPATDAPAALPQESIILAAIPAESIAVPVVLEVAPMPNPPGIPSRQTEAGHSKPARTAGKAGAPGNRKAPTPAVAKQKTLPAPKAAVETTPAAAPSAVAAALRTKRKAFSGGFFTVSILMHLVLGLGAGYWVVQEIAAKRKLQFKEGPPTASPSKRAMEHKVSLQKKKNAGGAPAQARRISVQGLASSITLPEMPAMPNASTQFVAGRMAGMGGAGFGTGLGFGNGSGMGVGGIGCGGLGLTMFGMRSSAEVVIVIDISGSMVQGRKNRKAYDELEEEAIKAIRLLGPNTKFNVIAFSGNAYTFEKSMVASSMGTKEAAIRWLKSYSPCLLIPNGQDKGNGRLWMSGPGARHSGTSSKKALDAAFDLKPGSIIFVTDGEPTDATPSVILKAVQGMQGKGRKTIINTIAYKADSGQAFLKQLAEQNGGQFKNIE